MSHLHAEALEVGDNGGGGCIQPNMGHVHEDKTGFAELTFSFPFSIGSSTTTWAAGKIGFIMLHFLGPLMRSIDQD